jgi:acyl carrier protein
MISRGGSLDWVELVIALEEAFGAEIFVRAAEKLRRFRTIDEAIN